MHGEVTPDREAVLRLPIRGPQREEEIVAILDTGFNGYLTLPQHLVSTLGLKYHSETEATLADGSTLALRKYEAHLLWEGRERKILILETDGGILVGMSLLYGNRVTLDLIDGRRVTIEPLSNT